MQAQRRSSLFDRMAVFEKFIAKNAEHAAARSVGPSTPPLKNWRKAVASDHESTRTASTCGTTSMSQYDTSIPQHLSVPRAVDGDDMLLCDLAPTNRGTVDDSLNSSMTLMDIQGDESQKSTEPLWASTSRLESDTRFMTPHAGRMNASFPCLSAPRRRPGVKSEFSGMESLQSLMLRLDEAED